MRQMFSEADLCGKITMIVCSVALLVVIAIIALVTIYGAH